MTADLEDLVRRTLATRAASVDSGASWPAPDDADVLDLRPRRTTRVRGAWAAVAAVAAVGLVAGIVVAARSTHRAALPTGKHAQPTTSQRVVTRSSCTAAVPAAWSQAAADHSVSLPLAGQMTVDGVLRDGSAVVTLSYDDKGTGEIDASLGLLAPGSSDFRQIAGFEGAGPVFALRVDTDGETVLVTVLGGNGSSDEVSHIVAIDATTGRSTTVASHASVPKDVLILPDAYVLDGHVYWMVVHRPNDAPQTVNDTDLATGRTTAAQTGYFTLSKSAAGIQWNYLNREAGRGGHLPDMVARQVTASTFPSFVTDGTSYAWQTADGSIEWWQPGARAVVRVAGLLGEPRTGPGPGTIRAVAGPLVFYESKRIGVPRVLDTRTGASVDVPEGAALYGHDGSLVGFGFASAVSTFTRVPTTGLPPARC